MPKVSVIVPNYNYSRYLERRIESILNQTFQDFEVIILDDCSTDDSRTIIERYRNHPKIASIVYNTENSGCPFKQWEKGISLSSGEYIWIAEADDAAEPDFIETLLPPLMDNKDVHLSMSMSYFIDSEDKEFQPDIPYELRTEDNGIHIYDGDNYILNHMARHNEIYNASMTIFKREAIKNFVNYDYLKMRYCGDWLYWINVVLHGKIASVHRRLNYFRRHKASVSHDPNGGLPSRVEQFYIACLIYQLDLHVPSDDIILHKYRLFRDYRKASPDFKKLWSDYLTKLDNPNLFMCDNSEYGQLWRFKHLIYPIKKLLNL